MKKKKNPHTADSDPEKDNTYIIYYDANNLYELAMTKSLPCAVFKWKTKNTNGI